LTLEKTSTGLFIGHAPLANGTYPYLFRVKGSTDDLLGFEADHVNKGLWMVDLANPQFLPSPPGAPNYTPAATTQKSASGITVPQVHQPVHDVSGLVTFHGVPQPCFSIEIMAGSPKTDPSYAADFAQTGQDGMFHFSAADGPLHIFAEFPFFTSADAGYPQVATTPLLGWASFVTTMADANITVDPLEVFADYSSLSPSANSTSVPLPVTFHFALLPNAKAAAVGVSGSTYPGGDPLVTFGPFGKATTFSFDGGGAYGPVKPGTPYYWAVWQRLNPMHDGGTGWAQQSLMLPITFQ
jgi:hypothetical protein